MAAALLEERADLLDGLTQCGVVLRSRNDLPERLG
jgi:hypothetical protein